MAAGACTFGARLCPCFVSLRLPVCSSRRLPHYELVIRCASVGGKKKNSSSSNKRSQTSSGSGFGTKIAAKPCKQKIPFPKLLASLALFACEFGVGFSFPESSFQDCCCHAKTSRSREESPFSHLSPCAFATFQCVCGFCCNQKVYKEL